MAPLSAWPPVLLASMSQQECATLAMRLAPRAPPIFPTTALSVLLATMTGSAVPPRILSTVSLRVLPPPLSLPPLAQVDSLP